MNIEETHKIRQNYLSLKEGIILRGKSSDLLDHLVASLIISSDDYERILSETTPSEKVQRLLRVILTKPNTLEPLCEALEKSGHEFLSEALRKTSVDPSLIEKEKEDINEQIKGILRKTYICVEDETTLGIPMEEIKREVEFGFLASGKFWSGEWAAVEMLLLKLYPKVKKKKKKGSRSTNNPVFQFLKRIDGDFGSSLRNQDTGDELLAVSRSKNAALSKTSSQSLCKILKRHFREHQLDLCLLDILVEEEVDGEIFMNLKMNETEQLFPDLKFGKRKKIILIRDDLKRMEEKGELFDEDEDENIQEGTEEEKNIDDQSFTGEFRETFRKFGCTVKESENYMQKSALISSRIFIQSLLDPLHKFVHEEVDEQNIPEWIAKNAMPFIAACLNERTNGTIHFGVVPFKSEAEVKGIITGIPVVRKRVIRRFYSILKSQFYEDDFESVCKCICQPQCIPITVPKDGLEESPKHLYVVEIDIIPSTLFTEDNVFFLRQTDVDGGKPKPVFFRFKKGSTEPEMGSPEGIRNYMTIKSKLTLDRKTQEEKPLDIKPKEDLRQKFLDLFSAGFDTAKIEIHPLLLLSPLESNLGEQFVAENFEFINDIDPEVIFDFDFWNENKGMYHFVEEENEKCLKVFTTDSFDKNGEEHAEKKDSYHNMLDDLRKTPIKPWIFCNGYSPLMKEPLKRYAWKQQRIEGFKEAVRFFSDEIPAGRAIVIFCLFSKNYDILLDAAEEVISKFKGHWLLFAETEQIANHWKKELLHRQCVDKKALDHRCIIGITWKSVNLMIKEVMGSKKQCECFIPFANGSICHLKEKLKRELFDLEILSANECDNDLEIMNDLEKRKEQRKTVEENFFKGACVTWWNLWFEGDHVLKRSIHANLLKKIRDACSKSDNEDESKVSIVKLYHQPGAGGTTSAMQVLWDMRKEYRCAVVKNISDITCEQIEKLRICEETETPKPPIILIDNGGEERINFLCAHLANRARITLRKSGGHCKVFCVLLLCIRRPNLPPSVNELSVQLRHDLDQSELDWFQNKGDTLQKQYLNENGIDPRLLLSFNLLKQNFNPEYRKEIIQQFVDNITDYKEICLLRYLSLMNSFDLDFQSVPVSAFDLLMTDRILVHTAQQQKNPISCSGIRSTQTHMQRRGWEVQLTQSLLVLINRSGSVNYRAQQKGLYIINQLFAKEIFMYIQDKMKMKTSDLMLDFLDSPMFVSCNKSVQVLHKIVGDIFKKRQTLDINRREKFSPLITDILAHENADRAAQVLERGFELLKDPMVAQQAARLYYFHKNWEKAEQFARIATRIKPDNSFLWDTYGQIFKTRLKEMYMEYSQKSEMLREDELMLVVYVLSEAINKFQFEQKVSEKEHHSKNYDNGYFAEIATIITFLDLLHFYQDTDDVDKLRRFLVDPNYVPPSFANFNSNTIQFIKTLNARTSFVMRFIDERISQLKWDVNSDLLSMPPDQRKMLLDLKENLDKYFGEDSDNIPLLGSCEQIEFVRRRIRKLGGSSLKMIIDLRTAENGIEKIRTMESLLLEKVLPHDRSLPDLITLVSARVIRNLNSNGRDKEFIEILFFSKQAYEMAISKKENHIYLEPFLFLVLFHWQTENRNKYANEMCPVSQVVDAIKQWKIAYSQKYPHKKDETNPYQRKETTFFYLGKGVQFAEIVYYEDLFQDERGSRYLRKGDSIWQEPAVRRRLHRIKGTLKPNGLEVVVQQRSSAGNVTVVSIPTSLPINNRALWNKQVFFFLGFSWSGPKAFDVSQENCHVSTANAMGTVKSSVVSSRGLHNRQVSSDVITNEDYLRKLAQLNESLQRIEQLKKLKVTSREMEEIQQERELVREREALIRRRSEFLSGTVAETWY